MTAREVFDNAQEPTLVLVTYTRLEVRSSTLSLLCLCPGIDRVPLEEFHELLQGDLGVIHSQRKVTTFGHFAYSFS